MKSKEEIWVDFACAALRIERDVTYPNLTVESAKTADQMLVEFESRYGNAARILGGISTCYYCQKPTGEDFIATDGKDGEYKKFCAACVAAVKEGKPPTNPGIAVCEACGQDTGTIFSCPGEPQPHLYYDDEGLPTPTSFKKDVDWRLKMKPRGTGVAHTFEK